MNAVEVTHLSFSYRNHPVLKDISLHVGYGEFLSILGCNGAGKSTLFKCILGLLSPYQGTIVINGKELSTMSIHDRSKEIAYIPQHTATIYNFSVENIVLMGTTSSLQLLEQPTQKQEEHVHWALEKIGIEHLSQRCYHQLSGGEQQLVIIARALAQNTNILMLDEPTSSLDFGNQLMVLNTMHSLAQEGYTVIQTTHNPEQAYTYSDRITAIKDGLVLKDGEPKEVITPEIISELYGVNVQISSLFDDQVRVCTSTF